MPDPLSSIAFVARSETRFFLLALARLLRERCGSTLHLYCSGPQEVAFYAEQNADGLFASINDSNILLTACQARDLDENAVIARAREWEQATGHGLTELSVANRHLGRGFSPGGFYHPRSRQSERTSYIQLLHAYSEALAFWEREFREKGVTLVLNGGKEAAVVARMLDLPFRAMAGSRIKNYHYWAWNEYYESPEIEAAFLSDRSFPAEDVEGPYLTHQVNRARAKKSFGLAKATGKAARRILQYAYWNLRGYDAARNYYMSDFIRLYYRQWREYRRLRRLAGTRLADLEGKPFVFFPLHVEPEAALQILSPEFFTQQAAIAMLSKDLPAGMLLAVKEHFAAIGRRPADFYRQIAELKNVVLLDTWELGFEVIRQAAGVATICGSAGFECAIMGKPVIAYGRHNIYNFLDHVHVVTDPAENGTVVRRATSQPYDREKARSDGQRLLDSVVSVSFDMRQYDYVRLREFSPESVEDALASLVGGLERPDGRSRRATVAGLAGSVTVN